MSSEKVHIFVTAFVSMSDRLSPQILEASRKADSAANQKRVTLVECGKTFRYGHGSLTLNFFFFVHGACKRLNDALNWVRPTARNMWPGTKLKIVLFDFVDSGAQLSNL